MFLIFGLFTMLIGIEPWWTLSDSPMACRFLEERERVFASRITRPASRTNNTQYKSHHVVEAVKDQGPESLDSRAYWSL
jgi:hypothetical protein